MQPEPSPPASQKKGVVPQSRPVSISCSGTESLLVVPDIAPIKAPGNSGPHRVLWKIVRDTVPDGGRLVIEFEIQNEIKGPFPPGSPHGQGRGRYGMRKQHTMIIDSGDTDQRENPTPPGYWKYKVEVFDADDKRVRWVDPGVAIDEDGGIAKGN